MATHLDAHRTLAAFVTPLIRRWAKFKHRLAARQAAFDRIVDAESIVAFQQYIYYPFIILFTGYLVIGAGGPPQSIEETLGTTSYHLWLVLGTVFPVLTLIGRRLCNPTEKAGLTPKPGHALLQLAGDFGVWSAIVVYMLCVGNTFWWGQAIWGVGFVAMGVPGGFVLTYRSWRRWRQSKRHATILGGR